MIIGFCGEKNIGKDTAAAYLIKEYEFQRVSFAEKVKESVAASLRIPTHEIEMHKNDPNVFVAIGYKNEPNQKPDCGHDYLITECPRCAVIMAQPDHMWSPISEQSFREFLYHFATEGHRDIFGPDFWMDQVLPVEGYYQDRKIVITDVRFQNEIDRINELGGVVCRIRKMLKSVDEAKAEMRAQLHSSEQPLLLNGVSYEIWNEGTIEELHIEVEKMLQFFMNPMGV